MSYVCVTLDSLQRISVSVVLLWRGTDRKAGRFSTTPPCSLLIAGTKKFCALVHGQVEAGRDATEG